MDEENDKKDIEVVQGIGNLDISPVYENTTSAKPKMKDEMPKNIVIPQVKKEVKKDENESDEEPKDETPKEDNSEIEADDEVFDDQIEFEDLDLNDDIDESDSDNQK